MARRRPDKSCLAGLAHCFAPAPVLTVTEWADKHRIIDDDASEPGRYRSARTPYIRGVMDAFCDPSVSRITFVKSARVGGSEAMNNCLLYAIAGAPGPSLYVLPTEQDAKDEATGRLKKMIESCPEAAKHIVRDGFATARALYLRGGRTIWMAWAAAPRTMIRRTCRHVFFDELDNCESEAGSLGNHLSVAAERVTTYGYRGKVMSATTPTHPDAAAWKEWEASDRRRYHVPCPHCGGYQDLTFSRIKIPEDVRDPERIEAGKLAWYACAHCEQEIFDIDRLWMVARGVWVPEAQTVAERLPVDDAAIVKQAAGVGREQWRPKLDGEPPVTRRVGFHIWSAYSPWRTFSEIAAAFLRAGHDREKLRVFTNSWLGETFKETSEDVDIELYREKRLGALPRGVVPDECLVMYAGVDVQATCCYYVIRGWGYDKKSWLIHEGVTGTLEDVYKIVMKPYRRLNGDILHVSRMAVDSGYRTQEVYAFVRAHQPGAYAVKGGGKSHGVQPSRIDYMPDGTLDKYSLLLHHVNTDQYKETVYRHARAAPGDPEYWALHRDATDDYCEQFCSEHHVMKLVTVNRSKRMAAVWDLKHVGAANHYLDCEVYAVALADFSGAFYLQPELPRPPRPEPQRETGGGIRMPDGRPFLITQR